MRITSTTIALLSALSLTQALQLDPNNRSSVLAAASTIKDDILRIYNQNSTGPAIPGLFPTPYYWWEGGLAFDSLINYVTLSNDTSIVSTIQDGILFQTGPDNNFMPPNQTKSLGNDDQATWALAVMTAAEQGFPQRAGQQVSWLQLAANVFDIQAARWDTSSCDGGLRWQIFTFNNGYTYKNSNTLGDFALLAARLYRYTGNATYSEWAQKAVQWSQDIGLVSENGAVYDGTDATTNCSTLNHLQWTINAGLFMSTGAYLANASTPNATLSNFGNTLLWRVLQQSLSVFTNGNHVISEVTCAPLNTCNSDQLAFRAPFVRALTYARDLLPIQNYLQAEYNGTSILDFKSYINDTLVQSAQGAAAQCSGINGTVCGSDWRSGEWDGTRGLGQDLAALEVVLANLRGGRLASANQTASNAVTGAVNGTATGAAPTQSHNAASVKGMGMSMGLLGVSALFWALV